MSEAAVAELFFVGKIATMMKAKPYIVIPYSMHIAKMSSKLDWTNTLSEAVSTKTADIVNIMHKRKKNQAMKYVSCFRPIMIIPSRPLLSFSSANFVTI